MTKRASYPERTHSASVIGSSSICLASKKDRAASNTHTANIALLGDYLDFVFVASDDGHGGTTIVDPMLEHELTALTQHQHVSDFNI